MNCRKLLLGFLVFFGIIFTINGAFAPENNQIDIIYSSNYSTPEENISVTLYNSNLNWSNYSYSNISYDTNLLNLTSGNGFINLSKSPYNQTYQNITLNFTTLVSNITTIKIDIANISGTTFSSTNVINNYSIRCPISSHNFTGRTKSNEYDLVNSTIFSLDTLYSIYFYSNESKRKSVEYDMDGLEKTFNPSSSIRDYFYDLANLENREYNLTAKYIFLNNSACIQSQVLDLYDVFSYINISPIFNSSSNRCSNFQGLNFSDTNLTNGNFTNLDNISLTLPSGITNDSSLFNIKNPNLSNVLFDNLSCNSPKAYYVNITYNSSFDRTYFLDLYEPTCENINLDKLTSQDATISEKQPYLAQNRTKFFWKGISTADTYFKYGKLRSNVKSFDFTAGTSTQSKNLGHSKIYSFYNNRTGNFTYHYNIDFNTTPDYPRFSCTLGNLTEYETADPNVSVSITKPSTIYSNSNVDIIFTLNNSGAANISYDFKAELKSASYCSTSGIFNKTNRSADVTCNIDTGNAGTKNLTYTFTYIKEDRTDNATYSKETSPLDYWAEDNIFDITVTDKPSGSGTSSSSDDNNDDGQEAPTKTATPGEETSDDSPKKIISDSRGSKEKEENRKLNITISDPNSQNLSSKINKLNNFLKKSIKHTQDYEIKDNKTIIKDTYRNVNIISLKDIIPTVTIPKDVVPNTDHITGDFYIVEYDPIIQFHLTQLDTAQELTLNYTINKTLTKEEITKITTNITSRYSPEDLEELNRMAEETAENVDIKVDVLKQSDGSSNVKATLDPKNSLDDTRVYLEIPKCLAEHVDEIDFKRDDYEVIEDDPVVAWDFDEIDKPLDLDFNVLKEVDEDCWEQIMVLPIAKSIQKKLIKQESRGYGAFILTAIAAILIIAPLASRFSHAVKNKDKGKKQKFSFIKLLEVGFEEIVLIALIVLNLLDFFGLLSPDLDVLKKFISWTFVSVLVYNIGLSKLFFGVKRRFHDLFLILAYFALTISEVISALNGVLQENISEVFTTKYFLNYLVGKGGLINEYSFYLGLIIIAILALLNFRKEMRRDSVMGVLHEWSKPRRLTAYPLKLATTLFLYLSFYVIFFKFFIEWLSVAIDAVIVVVALIYYISRFIIKHHKKANKDSLLYNVGNAGNGFIENFVKLFKDPTKIFFGITGMLVLHLIVDLSNFILPYLFSFQNSLYFLQLAGNEVLVNHTPLIPLLKEILPFGETLEVAKIIALYSLNFIAIIFCLTIPVIMWYDLYKGKRLVPHPFMNALFFSSLIAYLKTPLFAITPIVEKTIVGVDVSLLNIFDINTNFEQTLIFVGIAFTAVLILSFSRLLNHIFLVISIILSQLFFLYYVYSYVYSWREFFMGAIANLWASDNYIIATTLAIFFALIVLFYISGFIANLYLIFINYWITDKHRYDKHLKNKVIVSPKFDRKVERFIDKVGSIRKAKPVLLKRGIKEEIIDYEIKKIEAREEDVKKAPIIVDKKVDKEVFDYLKSLNSIYVARTNLLKMGWKSEVVDKYIDAFLKYF